VTRRVLVGGTGSGKKAVARALFRRHGLRPLAMDSMKVYRGMDVGTDKPSASDVAACGWGLLDLVGHDEGFSAGRWLEAAVAEAGDDDAPVLIAGGTPLYLRLLVRGMFPGPPASPVLRDELHALWDREGEAALRRELAAVDPEAEARLFPGDRKRLVRALEVARLTGRSLTSWQREETAPALSGRFVVAALRHEPARHHERLHERVRCMFAGGLVEEVEALQARAPFAAEPGRSIGYAEARALLEGRLTREQAEQRTWVRSRQLARRQRIFLASFPEIRWVDVSPGVDLEDVLPAVEAALEL
jgi:tRNA dimethylallyltransferase